MLNGLCNFLPINSDQNLWLNHVFNMIGVDEDVTNLIIGFLVLRPTKDEPKKQKDHLFINETTNLVGG